MTKPRPPVTIENRLYRVLGELGIERAAEVTGRSAGYLHNLTDPDKREQLTMRDAVLLDVACHEAGDPTFPLLETMGLLVRSELADHATQAACIGRHAQIAAQEGGEAVAALIAAALAAPGDTAADEHALRELEQAHEVYGDAIATVRSRLNGARAPQPP